MQSTKTKTKYVLPQKLADKTQPPPAPPPVPQQHKPTKKADTEEEDESWGEWKDTKRQKIPNMEAMPRGTRAHTPNKTTSAAASSSKSPAQRATTASKTPPPRRYGVWAGDTEPEEELHYDKKRDFSTGEGRARFVKEEITNLLFWQNQCNNRNTWPTSQRVQEAASHLKALTNIDHVIEETLLANMSMHIAASEIDLSLITQPIERIETEFRYYWKLPINGMIGPDLSGSNGMYDYLWAHASSSAGIFGCLKLKKLLRSFPEEGVQPYGFYCMCTSVENKDYNLTKCLDKAWTIGKNSSNIIIGGIASNKNEQGKAKGVTDEQRMCGERGIVHGYGRWCIKPSLAKITCLWMIQQKPIPLTESEDD